LISAGAYSLGHGTNDAQKTMRIIVALLAAGGKKNWATGGLTFLDTNSKLLFGLFWHATLRWDSAPFLAAGAL